MSTFNRNVVVPRRMHLTFKLSYSTLSTTIFCRVLLCFIISCNAVVTFVLLYKQVGQQTYAEYYYFNYNAVETVCTASVCGVLLYLSFKNCRHHISIVILNSLYN